MISGIPLPELDDDSTPFWEGCARNELLIQTCRSCGAPRLPPRPMCPVCTSFDHTWDRASGRGHIWSVAVPSPPLLPAFADIALVAPYNVIVVEIDEGEGLRLIGNLVSAPDAGINSVDPASIVIGEPVRVVFDSPVEDDHGSVTMPRWVRDPPG